MSEKKVLRFLSNVLTAYPTPRGIEDNFRVIRDKEGVIVLEVRLMYNQWLAHNLTDESAEALAKTLMTARGEGV